MDPNTNPFDPGAGTPPPELVGRDPITQQAEQILERIKRGRFERSLLLVGLLGVGKTVLLREIRRSALTREYLVEMIEAQEQQTLPQLLVQHCVACCSSSTLQNARSARSNADCGFSVASSGPSKSRRQMWKSLSASIRNAGKRIPAS